MSDYGGGDFADFGGGFNSGDLTPADWETLLGSYGMTDNGLGTTDPTSPDGTLTPGQIAGLGSSGGGSGGGINLANLLRSFGLGGNNASGGGVDWGSLLGLAGLIGGGINANNKTADATKYMTDAANKANEQVTGVLGNASKNYDPYTAAGTSAIGRMQNQPPSNLAGNFRPLGSGVALGAMARGR